MLISYVVINHIYIFQAPEKSEPVLADKEIIMAALNIKTMSFGSDYLKVVFIIIVINIVIFVNVIKVFIGIIVIIITMAALNIKTMSFGSDYLKVVFSSSSSLFMS